MRLLKQLKRLPGAHVFQYVDDDGTIASGRRHDGQRLFARTGQTPFTAKDFRTWKASALAAGILYENRDAETLAVPKAT